MQCKEKELQCTCTCHKASNAHVCYLLTDIKTIPMNVAIAQVSVDFQKSPSSDLIWCKTFRSDVNLPMDIETVTSDPFIY